MKRRLLSWADIKWDQQLCQLGDGEEQLEKLDQHQVSGGRPTGRWRNVATADFNNKTDEYIHHKIEKGLHLSVLKKVNILLQKIYVTIFDRQLTPFFPWGNKDSLRS